MEGLKVFIFCLILLISLSFISAIVTCDSISPVSYESGTSTTQTTSFQCSNSVNSSQVTLSKGGTASPYFDLDSYTISQSTSIPAQKTFNINFDEDASGGTYFGLIEFSDSSQSINFILDVQGSSEPIEQGDILEALEKVTIKPTLD